jgi:dihydrofolate reductase
MGKIVIATNTSLDGVVQDPTGDEGFEQGGWFGQIPPKDAQEWAKLETEEALGSEALLFGRRSYEWFAARWMGRTGEWADQLNSLLKGDPVAGVSNLKQEFDGDIVVYASYQLGRTLMEHDLVDELRLFVYPFVLGAGERLFGETSDKKPLRLLDSRTVGDGLAYVTYAVVRAA